MGSAANQLTNQVIDYIYRKGGFSFRASSVGIFDRAAGGFRTASKKGISDIIGIYKGRFIAIEVKIGKDKLKPEQEGFLRNVEHAGGISIMAKDFAGFLQEWQKKVVAP